MRLVHGLRPRDPIKAQESYVAIFFFIENLSAVL